ncbi:DUF418 domain-containing protein [Paenibacillus nanensis]|uniref:DUF418 domain-containing protein n=1 Tax=Paenibacillus nanensis TaxID=393251 RepID=A0A3A1VKC0_9BACL|nr:DUF418 domain-containing protein [Paenibacillus nanensis]RIX60182.1 DUF418 domain-containing protein [Paenibacillus nanensis]
MIQTMERQSLVDEIRGFSLLGILMANMLIFQYGMWGMDEMELFGQTSFDSWAHKAVKIFIEGSFMPIFSFLFGFGLFKQMQSQEARGGKFRRVLLRRFLMLLILGFLHSYFIWDGDILLFYGAIGFLLLLFLRRKAKTVLIWGIVLLSLFGLAGLGISGTDMNVTPEQERKTEQYVEKSIEVYQTGTYAEITRFRNNEPVPMVDDPLFLMIALFLIPFMTGPMFLFGIYAAKTGLFEQARTKRAFYAKGAAMFIVPGLILKTLGVISPGFIISGIGKTAGMPLLSIGYILGLAWLFTLKEAGMVRKGFASIGKLSLSNYLTQSVVCTTLFYGYGFGWFGKLGVTAGIGIALLLYILQMIVSTWYAGRFRIGPVEWLIRAWTYWSWRGRPKRAVLPGPVDTNA